HIVWLVIAFFTGGAFIFYFHDAPTLAEGFPKGEAPLTAYFFGAILTFTTYTLAGVMREQVCTYMCPWPRIQGALTDEHALNVTYRYDRGEPRGAHRKAESWDNRGDCIDCNQCVQVCPMGIDIRDGAQLECIHCALCIDACDGMMKRVGRPVGLIAYDTDKAVDARARGEHASYRIIRPRVVLYGVLIVLISALMAYGLSTRGSFEVNVLNDRSPPFIRLSDGSIRNGYTLKLVNKLSEPREMSLSIEGVPNMTVNVIGIEASGDAPIILPVAPYGVDRYRILVAAPEPSDATSERLTFILSDRDSGEEHIGAASFQHPGAP
ncbi:MAG: cytochrome c oxidase accessory protein CcoG, partial [Pseudomonadota bacterium]